MLRHISNEYHEDHLRQTAVVFYPTLTMRRLAVVEPSSRRRELEQALIVFMTDGSKSHRRLIPENELKGIGASEGLAASGSLGLSACDICFLAFKDTKLSEHLDAATNMVLAVLALGKHANTQRPGTLESFEKKLCLRLAFTEGF